MKKIVRILSGVLLLLSISGLSTATPLGINITIPDKNSNTRTWHGAGEDQEVEPGMQQGQKWDMEAFFLNGTTLSMVGGYDFINGQSGFMAGDIFIDINNDALYGDLHGSQNGNLSIKNTFGYDYVLDMDFATLEYDVYKIDTASDVFSAFYKQNQGSNPWRWESGGTQLQENRSFTYTAYTQGSTEGQAVYLRSIFEGDFHNVVTGLDLNFLGDDISGAIFHSTMQCGNDNLMGATPVPEPATMVLFGLGLLGIASLGRKRKK